MIRACKKCNGCHDSWQCALCPVGVLVGEIGHHPGALPGRDNATLTEPISGHVNGVKRADPHQPALTAR